MFKQFVKEETYMPIRNFELDYLRKVVIDYLYQVNSEKFIFKYKKG